MFSRKLIDYGLIAFAFLLGGAAIAPAADLPKVVLMGDSIRLNYEPVVAKECDGKAVVAGPKANGGDSGNLARMLATVLDMKPAVIHFNCGIHDTKKFPATGKFQVSPEQYEANLRAFVESARKQAPGVVLLFSTTTPILDDRAAAARKERDYVLLNASIEQYNAIALRVMKDLKVPVNDLHAVIAQPTGAVKPTDLVSRDGVHMTPEGRDRLAASVARFVLQHLPAASP